jgi:hypothetical protein
MNNRPKNVFDSAPATATVISFLTLPERAIFARVNQYNARMIHLSNTDKKFMLNSKVKEAVLDDVKASAKKILTNEPVLEPSDKLLLKKLANGEQDDKAMALIRNKTIEFKSTKQEGFYSFASASAKFANEMTTTSTRKKSQGELYFTVGMYALSAISAIAGYIAGYFDQSKKQKEIVHLRNRLQFFDHPDEKKADGKTTTDNKNNVQQRKPS